MLTLAEAFNKLLLNLKIPDGLHKQVTDRQSRLRATLVKDARIQELILGGSWARGTAIQPIHDVDMLVVIRQPEGSAADTQTWLASRVRELVRDTEVRIQRRSVGIRYPDFSFDLVPSLAQPDGVYLIATRDGTWLRSSPKRAKTYAGQRDQACGQMAIPLVRILKCWKRNRGLPVRSFHLELMALRSLNEKPPSYPVGLWRLLRALPGELDKACPDPARLADVHDGYLSDHDISAVRDWAVRDAERLKLAMEAEKLGPSAESLRRCREVIGKPFPG